MSAITPPESSVTIGISEHIRCRLFAFGYGVLLVVERESLRYATVPNDPVHREPRMRAEVVLRLPD